MNKLSIGLLLAASLFLIDVSPAAAHQGADRVSAHRDQHYVDVRRHNAMPRWLKRNKQFRHWYRHSPLKRYKRLGWSALYDIYRWERSYFASRRYYAKQHDSYRDDHRRRRDKHDY